MAFLRFSLKRGQISGWPIPNWFVLTTYQQALTLYQPSSQLYQQCSINVRIFNIKILRIEAALGVSTVLCTKTTCL
ncbi:hypothetical protein CN692_05230 [Bacillus sp. AFS002410]|uniref:hypothetical protein n=1 Tax=Bacillus sp. AFS002410 TaxID=2033481 RepID=UPI000BF1DDF5|nr:hypothetical protein [Bacillus sp. AFS002410]PEJ59593.1 hypothetical protein CN692_05230 [Bacillus sp. AFS002410]